MVVVIAILAAITIVSYNGMQQKALNSKAVVSVDVFKKALMLYALDHGSYPSYSASTICLGGGYPDKNGDGVGDCVVTASGVAEVSQVLPANDPLVEIIGNQPSIGGGPYR